MSEAPCNICPHNCNVERGTTSGKCNAPNYLKISSHMLHYGEEPVLCGSQGSGTIFFSHCNMQCVYCQNYKISAIGHGSATSPERFIEMVYELKAKGAININLVSPTPYTTLLIPLLKTLKHSGFQLPIVWNSNAYESPETLKQLEGLVDIYLPDLKYWNNTQALKFSNITGYPENAQKAIIEMYRQTGNLRTDEDGIAYFGTMIRLLVLPNDINNIESIFNWISTVLSSEVYISLMGQYYPTHKAFNYPEINRGITQQEYACAVQTLQKYGFENGFVQQVGASPEWTPRF